jgi:hypothetical protein
MKWPMITVRREEAKKKKKDKERRKIEMFLNYSSEIDISDAIENRAHCMHHVDNSFY